MTKLKGMENGKVLQVSWYEAASPERQELYNVEISHSHAYALLTLLQYLRWKTRWMDYEDWNETLDYVNDIEYRLLTPIVCEDGMTEEEFKALVCAALDECLVPQLTEWYNALLAAIEAIEAKQDIINNTVNNISTTITDVDTNVTNISSTVTQINNTTNITNIGTTPPTPAEKTGTEPIIETRTLQASGITQEQFYGACISIVDGLVEAMVDYFERLEVISNTLELAAIIGGSIPVVGDSAAAAAELANFVQEVAMEMFLAADTQPRRLNLADKFYCKGKHVKALDMNMIGEALAEAWIGDLIDWNDPIGSLARIASGEFAPEQAFYISLGLGLAVWTVTGDFEGLITRAAWRFWVNRGKNNPQEPVPDCGPSANLIMRVRGTRYRIDGGPWIDLVWDVLGQFVDFGTPSLPFSLEVEDAIEPTGYMIIGESPSATAPIVTVSVSPEPFYTSQRDNPATAYHNPGDVASGSRIDVPDANRNCTYIISKYEV